MTWLTTARISTIFSLVLVGRNLGQQIATITRDAIKSLPTTFSLVLVGHNLSERIARIFTTYSLFLRSPQPEFSQHFFGLRCHNLGHHCKNFHHICFGLVGRNLCQHIARIFSKFHLP
jgi:hypothetical protein